MLDSNKNMRREGSKDLPTTESGGRSLHKGEISSPIVSCSKIFGVPELFPQDVVRGEVGPGFTYSQPYVFTRFLSSEEVAARRAQGEKEGDAFAADQTLRRARQDEEEARGDGLGRRR